MFSTVVLAMLLLLATTGYSWPSRLFNTGCELVKDVDTAVSEQLFSRYGTLPWQEVSLPHTADIKPVKRVTQQYYPQSPAFLDALG